MARSTWRGAEDAAEVMTVDQVAAYLQLNRLTVYRYIREGKIPAARFGKSYRILKADVDRFLESQKVPRPNPLPSRPVAPPGARVRSIWVREFKDAREISVRPTRKERTRDVEGVIVSADLTAFVMRSLN